MTYQIKDTDIETWFNGWNSHDVAIAQELFADDVVIYEPLVPEPLKGKAGLAGFFAPLFKTYPNIHFEPEYRIVQGNEAVSFEIVTGTMTGRGRNASGQEIEPTGKSFNIKGAIRIRYNDTGKIDLVAIYWDRYLLFQQLGLLTA